MVDPEFPWGGGANSPGGVPTYNFAKISQKLHEIKRIWTPRGAHFPHTPPKSANDPDSYRSNQNCSFNFEAPTGRRIVVFFEDFHLEDEFDFIHFCELSTMETQMNKQA